MSNTLKSCLKSVSSDKHRIWYAFYWSARATRHPLTACNIHFISAISTLSYTEFLNQFEHLSRWVDLYFVSWIQFSVVCAVLIEIRDKLLHHTASMHTTPWVDGCATGVPHFPFERDFVCTENSWHLPWRPSPIATAIHLCIEISGLSDANIYVYIYALIRILCIQFIAFYLSSPNPHRTVHWTYFICMCGWRAVSCKKVKIHVSHARFHNFFSAHY